MWPKALIRVNTARIMVQESIEKPTVDEERAWFSGRIFIPTEERGGLLQSLDVSVRLANVLEAAHLRLIGDLHGLSYEQFSRFRNCGRKTVAELRDIVRHLQFSNGENPPFDWQPTDGSPNILKISDSAHAFKLVELPLSVRLQNALNQRGLTTLGDVHDLDVRELLKIQNCGRKCIVELRALIQAVDEGQFSPTQTDQVGVSLREIAQAIDSGLRNLAPRDTNLFQARLFGNSGRPRTLEDVGKEYHITRERVRQIVNKIVHGIRLSGGPKLARALEAVARECQNRVCPLTPELFCHWITDAKDLLLHEADFYVRILDDMEQTIPAWPKGSTREGSDDPLLESLDEALQTWLRECDGQPTTAQAWTQLRRQHDLRKLSAGAFLAGLRRSQNVLVDLADPESPMLQLRTVRMTILEFARPVLEKSEEPLTPEQIVATAREKFGNDAIVVSGRGAGNTLTPDRGFFLLGPRRFGVARHFSIPRRDWPNVCDQLAAVLKRENRPVSTIEVVDKHRLVGFDSLDSYEMAEIIRGDRRFIDLGRKLFALAEWGVQEREHVYDLLPRVFNEAKHALTIQQTLSRMTRLRSVSPNSIANLLQKHPKIRSFGFGYYGLASWGVAERRVMLSDVVTVESAVRRASPPICFAALCESFGICADSTETAVLWKTCTRSQKLRRAPDRQSLETLLMHKAVSLELALATIARQLERAAPAYELEWELSAKFGSIFAHIGLATIEERLARSPRFLRNAAGEFLLDTHVDLAQYDVEAIRAAVIKSLTESADVVASDELIERLAEQGFDVSDLSADMLASILRGATELQEVGRQRFRAK